ncbi:cAMP-binding domain of CRP or a regulatory subunit of cAMP-dependent protein kinases [Saccharopolyspora antimicrobica]|uniref:CRP-like cAMP-binding protein n=1 Tax=Saccharopolyspora antimicrobica TaxID=455193 RepID=A0A1I4YE60_9PSEU|nr:Crp/Fnr family transcriptional regulator [Saccharopolyspora antimicrobica]RKT82635.1 CRP-like cAMP-binding protein [Saccharopolyspora antimicrobica]SFN36317.1 cAMP-binding domain of CRP or a regulatory subunit of cAMP-dependent protein kinases [Saccharopolyspora antimicrobica]
MDTKADEIDANSGYALHRNTFTTRAGEEICAELRELGLRRSFSRNEFLFTTGTPSDHVLLLERGLAKVILPGNGRDLVAGIYGPGELIGEQGVLFAEQRSASVEALMPVEATRISGRVFQDFLTRNPRILRVLYSVLAERLRKADHRQVSLASQDVQTRVARQLLAWVEALGQATDEGIAITGLSRKDLSQCIGAGETTVDSVLKDLTARGLVLTHWRKYVLPSPQRLRELIARPQRATT